MKERISPTRTQCDRAVEGMSLETTPITWSDYINEARRIFLDGYIALNYHNYTPNCSVYTINWFPLEPDVEISNSVEWTITDPSSTMIRSLEEGVCIGRLESSPGGVTPPYSMDTPQNFPDSVKSFPAPWASLYCLGDGDSYTEPVVKRSSREHSSKTEMKTNKGLTSMSLVL